MITAGPGNHAGRAWDKLNATQKKPSTMLDTPVVSNHFPCSWKCVIIQASPAQTSHNQASKLQNTFDTEGEREHWRCYVQALPGNISIFRPRQAQAQIPSGIGQYTSPYKIDLMSPDPSRQTETWRGLIMPEVSFQVLDAKHDPPGLISWIRCDQVHTFSHSASRLNLLDFPWHDHTVKKLSV